MRNVSANVFVLHFSHRGFSALFCFPVGIVSYSIYEYAANWLAQFA